MDPTGFFVHPAPPLPSLPSDLFPFHRAELAAPGSWDAGSSSSWFPASVQQPNIPVTLQWDDPSIQPDWDDLVSSFQPAAARTPSTGLSAGDLPNDSYDIDLLMANISGWSSSGSHPVLAAPSSAYSDARGDRPVIFTHFFGVSCLLSLPSPPFVSVEIEQWDGTNWATADLPCIEADVPLADEAPNMDACLGWDFKPSNVKWLDPDVSSEVAEFPQGTRLTEKNKIYAFHRVTGCPSQFPFFRQRTGFLINLTDVKGMNSDRETTVDQRIRDQCLSNIPLERWNTMEAMTNLDEAQHAWNNAQTGILMGVIESFKKYEELNIRRAEEIEVHKSTAVSRTSWNEVTHRYASRTTQQTRMSEKARCAHAVDSTVAGLQTELADMQRDLAIARNDAKIESLTQTAEHVRELEDTLADLEGKLKLAKAEVKSSSSGRVRAPKASAHATTSNVPTQPADRPEPALSTTVVATSASPELSFATPASVADGTSDPAGTRRASTRKRMQAESSAATSIPSRKR
ncbi:hypothetical protein B0H14DRAFT_3593056 [Mycena olivaceomarginata]|nr:hypothetical protein B0H14DRAFT_3593056 [Mycena olivaceomarginata]